MFYCALKCFSCIYYNYAVPTSAPLNPTGIVQSSTSILLSWDPPSLREQNGIIREYRINVTELDTGRALQEFTTTSTSITIAFLHPFYTYEWMVSAFTVGIGPYTESSSIKTPEDGMSE